MRSFVTVSDANCVEIGVTEPKCRHTEMRWVKQKASLYCWLQTHFITVQKARRMLGCNVVELVISYRHVDALWLAVVFFILVQK